MTEIVNCPFCGGIATVGGLVPWVECQSCGASGPQKTTEAEAITAWNTRHGAGDAEVWRSIESAPRDGTYILLGYAGSHSEEGRWVGDASRNHWGETGWFASDDDVLCEHPSKPSHWRPLPAPPRDDAARAGERG